MKKRHSSPQLSQMVAIDVGMGGGEWPDKAFWTMYGDAQLTALVEQALANNPSLQAATSRVEQVRQEAYTVRAKMFPHIGARADTNWEHLSKDSLLRYPPSNLPSVINQTMIALDFKYEFDFWGKNLNSFRAALGQTYATMAESAQADLMLSVALCQVYFDWQANRRYEEVWTDIIEERKAYAGLIRLKQQHALADQIEVETAEQQVYEAEEQLLAVQEAIALNVHQIHVLLGIGPGEELELKSPIARYDGMYDLPDTLPLDLLSRRPDLIASVWRATAAAYDIRVAKTAFYPNVDMTAFVGLQSLEWSKLFTADSYAAQLRPAVHLPVFTAGKLTANLRSKEAFYNAAVYDYNNAVLEAARQVADSAVQLRSSSHQLDVQGENVRSYEKNLELMALRYATGLGNYLEVLRARDEVFREQMKQEQLEIARLSATLMLVKSLGGGYICGAK